MKLRWLALTAPFLLAPFACSSDDSTDSDGDENSETGDGDGDGDGDGESMGEGGDSGNTEERACLFNCDEEEEEEPSGTGGMAMTKTEEELDKGSRDFCLIGGVETRGVAGGELLIADFEDGENEFVGNGSVVRFHASHDGVGTSNIGDSWESEGPGRGEAGKAIHLVGSGFTEWGAGVGLVLGYQSESDPYCLYDASAFSGFTFWAKGNSEVTDDTMRVNVQIPRITPEESGGSCEGGCWNSHHVDVKLTGDCWQQYVVSWSDLAQEPGWGVQADFDPEHVTVMEWQVKTGTNNSEDPDFDFWVDDISFFEGAAPTAQTECGNVMGN